MPNLVSPVAPALDIVQNMRVFWGVFSISRFLVKSLIYKNCQNSKISNNTELGSVTKLDKRNTTMSKKLTTMPCWQIMTSLSFFQIYGQFGVMWKPNSKHTVFIS